jgi:hypothetical protein
MSERVEPAYVFLDGKLVAALRAVSGSHYLSMVRNLHGLPLQNPDLSFLARSLYEYAQACERVSMYFERQIRPLIEFGKRVE